MGRLDVRRILRDPLRRKAKGLKERREERDAARHLEYLRPYLGRVQTTRWTLTRPGSWACSFVGVSAKGAGRTLGWARITRCEVWIVVDGPRGPRPVQVERWVAELIVPGTRGYVLLGGECTRDTERSPAVFATAPAAKKAVQGWLDGWMRDRAEARGVA